MIKASILENLYKNVRTLIPKDCELIIAGGCIRDYFNERSSFKDVDFFLSCENREHYLHVLESLTDTFGKGKCIDKNDEINDEQYENFRNLLGVQEYTFRFGTPFQIIGIQKLNSNGPPPQLRGLLGPEWGRRAELGFAKEVLSTFDFDINCSYYDGNSFIETDEAKVDRYSMMFSIKTCRNNGLELIKVIDKFKRLSETKYKNYSLNFTKDSFIY